MLEIHLPDESVKNYEAAVSVGQIAADIGAGLAKAAMAGEVDGTVVGLDYQLPADGKVDLKILTKKDRSSLNVMRHSCAHVMARAVMRRFEGVQLAFGPTIEGGFYYDFELEHSLTEDDFPAIEDEMKKIIAEDEPFQRVDHGGPKLRIPLHRWPACALGAVGSGRTSRGREVVEDEEFPESVHPLQDRRRARKGLGA